MRNKKSTSFVSSFVFVAIAAAAAFAQSTSDDWSGAYVGGYAGITVGRTGVNTSTIFDSNGYFLSSSVPAVNAAGARTVESNGFTGGGQVGYNKQFGRFVVGAEADFGAEPVVAAKVFPDTPAERAGLLAGDKVIAFNGKTVRNSQELTLHIRENKDAPGKLTVERNGERVELTTVAAEQDGAFRIGANFGADTFTTRVPVGAAGAAAFAYESNMRILRLTGRVFGQMFSGERSVRDAGLAGPVGIVTVAPF